MPTKTTSTKKASELKIGSKSKAKADQLAKDMEHGGGGSASGDKPGKEPKEKAEPTLEKVVKDAQDLTGAPGPDVTTKEPGEPSKPEAVSDKPMGFEGKNTEEKIGGPSPVPTEPSSPNVLYVTTTPGTATTPGAPTSTPSGSVTAPEPSSTSTASGASTLAALPSVPLVIQIHIHIHQPK